MKFENLILFILYLLEVFNCCVEHLKELNVLEHGVFGGVYQMIHKSTGHIMLVQAHLKIISVDHRHL